MTHPFLFREYIWLVKTIYDHRRISLSEINRLWVDTDMSGGVEMARSTFNRHKDAIEDIFGIVVGDGTPMERVIVRAFDTNEDTLAYAKLSTIKV